MRDATCNCNDVTGIIKNDITVLFDHYTKAEIDEMRAALCRVIDGKADDTTVQTLITELGKKADNTVVQMFINELAKKADNTALQALSAEVNKKAGTNDLAELAQTVETKVDAEKVAEMIAVALETTVTAQDIKNLFEGD